MNYFQSEVWDERMHAHATGGCPFGDPARAIDEGSVDVAERRSGEEVVEAPVADGLDHAAAGRADPEGRLRGSEPPEDVDGTTLRTYHRLPAVGRSIGRLAHERERERRDVHGCRWQGTGGGSGRRCRHRRDGCNCKEEGEGDERDLGSHSSFRKRQLSWFMKMLSVIYIGDAVEGGYANDMNWHALVRKSNFIGVSWMELI